MVINKLFLISVAGTVACTAMVFLFNRKVSDEIKKTNFYKEAMDIVKHHKGALYLLGHPIQDSNASFNGLGMFFNNQSDVKVHVSGPKSDGIVFFTVLPETEEKRYLSSVQLQIGKDDSKRLVIKSSSDETASKS